MGDPIIQVDCLQRQNLAACFFIGLWYSDLHYVFVSSGHSFLTRIFYESRLGVTANANMGVLAGVLGAPPPALFTCTLGRSPGGYLDGTPIFTVS